MILTAVLFAASLSDPQPVDIMSEAFSAETRGRYMAYVNCFARGTYDRRSGAGSPEDHMKQAKASCRAEHESLVEGIVKDLEGSSDSATATASAHAFIDEMDSRAVIGPPAPAALAQLPVERMVGAWRLGGGALAVHMTVRYESDGSMVGILNPPREFTAKGL